MLRVAVVFAFVVAVALSANPPPPAGAGPKVPPGKLKDHRDKPIDKDHYHDGEHDADYDHEAILGSKDEEEAFSHLDPDEAKKRLGLLVDRMDANKDGKVTQDELRDWILHSFRMLDDEDSQSRFTDNDENGDGNVTWPEFLDKMYGYTPKDLEGLKKDTSEEMKEFVRLVDQDKKKFELADVNKDGHLEKSEYPAFSHPFNHQRMHQFEVEKSLEDHDKNKDGKISMDEYIGEGGDKEHNTTEAEAFNNLDLNKDGHLDNSEILKWVVPDHSDTATVEAKHLIKESDKDNDGQLTKDEILDKHDLWVGSQAGAPHFEYRSDDREEL